MQPSNYRYLFRLFQLFMLLTACHSAQAQRFDLDRSFDSDGKLQVELTPPISTDKLWDVYPQGGGKFITLITSSTLGTVAQRFNADGSLDTSYGTNGRITYPASLTAGATQLVWLPNNQLVGIRNASSAGSLFRVNADGTPDATFGVNGVVIRPNGSGDYSSSFNSLRVQADGKPVVVGSRNTGTQSNLTSYMLIDRYNANGTPDVEYITQFALTGKNTTDGMQLAIQPDGALLATGLLVTNSTQFQLVLVRLLASGTADPGFGTAGKVATNLNYNYSNGRMLLQPDGKFIIELGQQRSGGVAALNLARFLPSGALDSSFGTSGVATFSSTSTNGVYGPYEVAGYYSGGSLALQADNKILVGGTNGVGLGLLRLNADGTKDSSFGSNFDQTIKTEFADPAYPNYYITASARGIAVQADGTILTAATVIRQVSILNSSGSSNLVGLARYSSVGSPTLTQAGQAADLLSIYPNPIAGGPLHLSASAGLAPRIGAQLINALGQVVRQQTLTSQDGSLDTTLSVVGLPAGIYMLHLTSGQQVYTQRVILR